MGIKHGKAEEAFADPGGGGPAPAAELAALLTALLTGPRHRAPGRAGPWEATRGRRAQKGILTLAPAL
jgi:hypothetical protein